MVRTNSFVDRDKGMVRNVSNVDNLVNEKAKMAKIEADAKKRQDELEEELNRCQDAEEQEFWDKACIEVAQATIISDLRWSGEDRWLEGMEWCAKQADALLKHRRQRLMTSECER